MRKYNKISFIIAGAVMVLTSLCLIVIGGFSYIKDACKIFIIGIVFLLISRYSKNWFQG